MESYIESYLFVQTKDILESEIPKLEKCIADHEERLLELKKELHEKNGLVNESCEKYGFKIETVTVGEPWGFQFKKLKRKGEE